MSLSKEFSRLVQTISVKEAKTPEEQVLKDFIKLILKVARKYVRPSVDYEDLIMSGVVGLLQGFKEYDPERSSDMKTYIITRIKSNMYVYCITNSNTVYIPTHIGKTKVYFERMEKLLDKEPIVFSSGVPITEIILEEKHPIEEKLSSDTRFKLEKIKDMVHRMAKNSKTTYKCLISLAYESKIMELSIEEIESRSAIGKDNTIERDVAIKEVLEQLEGCAGEKKAAILSLHCGSYNNMDISDYLYENELTNKLISRQAIKGLLETTISKARKYVRKDKQD